MTQDPNWNAQIWMKRGAESACRRAFRCGCVCRSVCALCVCGLVNQRRARACGFKEFCWVCRTASQAHNNLVRRCCVICRRSMYGIELGGWHTLCDARATTPARQRCGNCDVSLINYFEWYRAHNGCAQVEIKYSKREKERERTFDNDARTLWQSGMHDEYPYCRHTQYYMPLYLHE